MQIRIKENGNTALVSVTGKLTATTLEESLRGAVKNLLQKKYRRIVIDLGQVVHIDSTGVGELVSAYTSASNEKAELTLYDVPDSCREMLELTNLLDIFTVLPKGDVTVAGAFPS